MPLKANAALVQKIQRLVDPLSTGGPQDFDSLLECIGEARFVLMGESTHGTHEFYKFRAELSKRLIREKGFQAIAVEADWPDSYRINRYIRGWGSDAEAVDALSGFQRFPTWMWRNADVLDLIGWLQAHNEQVVLPTEQVGFYGLDLYSLYTSMDEVIAYLQTVDPVAAEEARRRYACFVQYGEDPQEYARATGWHFLRSCEQEVVEQLLDLRREALKYMQQEGIVGEEAYFCAEQNARLVQNAEVYYRTMARGTITSWNVRDQHMMETLEALVAHFDKRGHPAKIIVWAHNSHLGDARATQPGEQGEWNLGQLVRQKHRHETFLLGLTTYQGTVTAASEWGGPAQRKAVRPALTESYEALFHETQVPKFFLSMKKDKALAEALRNRLLERAIGVLYFPATERQSHYFTASLSQQFDGILHIDTTRAVEPLERTAEWRPGDEPETYPTGM